MVDSDLPIDRGWAWVILFGATLIQLVTIGCLKSFGLIYAEFLDYFQASAGSTAWLLSLAVFLLMSCGTLSSNLGKRFGFRSVLIAASILSCIGYVSSAFVSRLEWLYLTIGIVTGLGVGLTYTPTVIMVTMYFNKRRAFANGVAVAGNGVGFFLYPFLINYLLQEYALFGTLIILGGVILHSCIGAALMLPLSTFIKKKPNTEMEDMGGNKLQTPENMPLENHMVNNEVTLSLDSQRNASELCENKHDVTSDNVLQEKDNTVSETFLQNGHVLDAQVRTDNTRFSCLNCVRNFKCKDIFDYTYLWNPVFVLYGCSFAFANMSYSNLFIVIPPHARMCQVAKSDIAMLVSLAGLADLLGRIMFGWVSDLKFIRRRYVYIFGMFAAGISALLAPLATNFTTIALYSCWYGLFGGSYWSLVAPLMADSFGVEKIPVVFGLITSFISFPSLVSPPLLGWLRDITGNWEWSFRLAGVWMILAGICATLIPLGERYMRKKEPPKETNVEITT